MEKKGETKDEANIDIREAVRMELSILDCPVCYNALRAPIFQCGVGHVLCSNCNVLLNECPQCSGTIFQRCFIMERVVESIVAPCSFSRYGCVEEITRFNKNKHENVCSYRPCFCPHSGCSFAGITASLLVHFTTHHKWPSMKFEYYKPFLLPVRPGPCLLHPQDEHLFLMNMEPLEPLGHAISLVCIQPDGRESMYGCSVNFSCFIGHNQTSTLGSGFGKGDNIALEITKRTDCTVLPDLSFDTHHSRAGSPGGGGGLVSPVKKFKPCPDRYTDYTPCQDQNRAMKFPRENMNYRERHCPPQKEKLRCLIPPPKGYVAPFPWPKSRDYVPFANCPYKSLTVEKAIQNWVQYEGNVFRFPGGGTQFPQGADKYIDQLASVVPIDNGTVRTALDTGCGVASLGAYLLKRNVLAMSFAPRDSHEAQVQFALERGVPAVIGVLGTVKLPYPARAFDMAHCSRCLIPWGANDGMYMMEVDRVLRPGGYWVLSGPPINWKANYKGWQRTKEDLEAEQNRIEEIAALLCWEKVAEKGEMAIWRKRVNTESCPSRQDESTVQMCESTNPDDVWYKKMKACVMPLPDVKDESDVAGGAIKPFPGRLNAVPPRIANGLIPGVSSQAFQKDNKMWKKHVNAYSTVNKYLLTGRYRNIMDMNAGFGGFAAAIESPKSWVMNVVPTIAKISTLGAVYERGLIGIYHDWCEAFSTYPRTYDLIHASGLFTLYKNKCSMEDILLEMDRILRPEGAVIMRDDVDILTKVNRLALGMRWSTKLVDHEDGPLVREKVLYAVKQYWVGGNQTASA